MRALKEKCLPATAKSSSWCIGLERSLEDVAVGASLFVSTRLHADPRAHGLGGSKKRAGLSHKNRKSDDRRKKLGRENSLTDRYEG